MKENLDTEELVQLSLFAADQARFDDTLQYLKEASHREPENPFLALLLASTYIQLRMPNRADAMYSKALALEPTMHIARLQQALLYSSGGLVAETKAVLEPLLQLDQEDFYWHFATGICALIEGKVDEASMHLKSGIRLNRINPALNDDIQRLIEQISPQKTEMNMGESTESENKAFLLSSYQKTVKA